MKRKVYTAGSERRSDQVIGFWLFPFVNAALLILVADEARWAAWLGLRQTRDVAALLPWIVNGIVLVWAFAFRPEIAVGYLAFIASVIAAATALSTLFVAACFVSVASYAVIGQLALVLFCALMLGGLYFLFTAARVMYTDWRSGSAGQEPPGDNA